jgi:hypothetical protein
MKKFFRLVFVWIFLLSILQQDSVAQYTVPDQPGTSRLSGKVIDSKGHKVRDARILAYHISSEALHASEPTRGNGEFRIGGLAYGYYDVAVETPDGLYVADRVVNLAPAGAAVLILTVVAYQPADEGRTRMYPASETDPVGHAELRKKLKGREFWRSPTGVAILAGIGGAVLLSLAVGSDDEPAATQF